MAASPEKPKNKVVIDLCFSTPPGTDKKSTPLRPIFCVKDRKTMKDIEHREDCFILDFDPDDPLHKNLLDDLDDASPDISVVAERGKVACRDYPHSRHLCLKCPFANTPHESHCELCYCFVCDVSAPCKKWTGSCGHCHARDNEAWQLQRKKSRRSRA